MQYQYRDAAEALSGRGDMERAIRWMRRKCGPRQLDSIFTSIALTKGSQSDNLFGKLFPENWKECISTRREPITLLPRAIQWHLSAFIIFGSSLSEHVSTRDLYFQEALAGNWNAAEDLTASHHKDHGCSLWQLAQFFLVHEEKFGADSNRRARDQFAKNLTGYFIGSLGACYSIRAEKTSTLDRYESLLTTFSGNNPDPNVQCFIRLLLSPQPVELPEDVAVLLGFIEILPLVDRFECFCRIALLALAQRHKQAHHFITPLQALAARINDPLLRCAAESCEGQTPSSQCVNPRLLSIWDRYVAGDYLACIKDAEVLAKTEPLLFQAHELFVKSRLYCNRPLDSSATSPLDALWRNLYTIYDKSELTEDALSGLNSVAIRFGDCSIAWSLMAVCELHSKYTPNEVILRLAAFTQRAHGPRNAEHGFTLKHNCSYLSAIKLTASNSIAVNFFSSVGEGNIQSIDNLNSTVPLPRLLFFKGIALLNKGLFTDAVKALELYLDCSKGTLFPSSPFAVEEARVAMARGLLITNGTAQLQQIISAAHFERPHSVKRFPLRAIYQACWNDRKLIASDISFPILAYLASDDPHVITMAMKVFLTSHGCRQPSALRSKAATFQQNLLATFLTKVCTLDVLESLDCMSGTGQVEQERIAILTWLSELRPDFQQMAQSEILRITEAAELREALEWIEASRVAINLTGIKEAEELQFKEAFLRFSAYLELIPHIAEIRLRPLGEAGGRQYFSAPPEEARKLISAIDGNKRLRRLFADAFLQIRDVFLNSPQFGLDSCLSVRIRHGILAQHIRRPFSENLLFVDPLEAKDNTIVNHWVRHGELNDADAKRLAFALTTLSNAILVIINEVKNEWIQVTTEVDDSKPIFNYAYSELAIERVFQRTNYAQADYSQFLDGIFEELFEQTKQNLTNARERIKNELRDRLTRALLVAEEQCSQLSVNHANGVLRDAISKCRNDLERTVQTMERWFHGADVALLEDVSYEIALNTAIGMAFRLFPEMRTKISASSSGTAKLKGKYFSSLVHLIFFLIENGLKHSQMPAAQQFIRVVLSANSGIIQIEATNLVASEDAAKNCVMRINKRILEVEEKREFSKVRSEGGSGLEKVIATVLIEFSSQKYNVTARSSGNSVTVSASFGCSRIQ